MKIKNKPIGLRLFQKFTIIGLKGKDSKTHDQGTLSLQRNVLSHLKG
jgi:hypothetical protein